MKKIRYSSEQESVNQSGTVYITVSEKQEPFHLLETKNYSNLAGLLRVSGILTDDIRMYEHDKLGEEFIVLTDAENRFIMECHNGYGDLDEMLDGVEI